jgi:hypothetical protein
VGKGCNGRAYARHRIGNAPSEERIIIQDFESEADAFEAEKFLISYYGREDIGLGHLLNRADGGEGTSGARLSPETRAKMSVSRVGNKNRLGKSPSLETRAKISVKGIGRMPWNKGKSLSPETRAKMSAALIGNTRSSGYKHSSEALAKMKIASTGRKHSPETRAQMSAMHIGKVISTEIRAKISATKISKAAYLRNFKEITHCTQN